MAVRLLGEATVSQRNGPLLKIGLLGKTQYFPIETKALFGRPELRLVCLIFISFLIALSALAYRPRRRRFLDFSFRWL